MRTLDVDKDSTLSPAETKGATEALLALDKNNDGELSLREIGGPGPILGMMRLQPLIRVLDTDGDLKLSTSELTNAAQSLLRLDRDGDKHLSKENLSFQKILDTDYEEMEVRLKILLWQYTNKIIGNVLPGTDSLASEGLLLVHETSNHNDVQVGRHTYLLNNQGLLQHGWFNEKNSPETSHAQLLDNGLLIRSVSDTDWIHREQYPFGSHGMIELVAWDGSIIWNYKLDYPGRNILHHDFEPMPNGNILVTAYVGFTLDEARQLGFDTNLANGDRVWFDTILEIKPNIENLSASVVWQWNSWDHIVQDEFPDMPNYGQIRDNPDRIDVNAHELKSLLFNDGELHHINAVSYHAGLDQILLSSAIAGEIWVIDHSTSKAEAATHKGGKHHKGGRLLYRWGNPMMTAQEGDRVLFWQHDASWVDTTSSSNARVLIFNSGHRRSIYDTYTREQTNFGLDEAYTDLLEIELPLEDNGNYNPSSSPTTLWTWNADDDQAFFAPFPGGTTRLKNGNTLFVQSNQKRILEVTRDGKRVLDFSIPGPGQIYSVDKIPFDHPGLRFNK